MNFWFTDEQRVLFSIMTDFMLKYNEKVNLTGIVETDEIDEKHYIDSVLPLEIIDVPRGTSIIDVGTGAGFPGVPMKIVRPDLDITLLDSLQKRTNYLKMLSDKLGIETSIIHGRSEELAHDKGYRERFDMAVSRAVANLSSLCEYTLPLIKVGGTFLALKGEKDETAEAETAIKLLGGTLEKVHRYSLPGGDKRMLVQIRKISQTPTKYPRKRVNIAKNPL